MPLLAARPAVARRARLGASPAATPVAAIVVAATVAAATLAAPALAQSPPVADAPPPPAARSAAARHAPAADMQAVLDAQAALGPKPIETLTPAEARLQPSPADGALAVMTAKGIPPSDATVATRDIPYGGDPAQIVRVYRPVGAGGGLPIIVYYHGGGWVIADLKTYDATPRFMAKALGAMVVSVEYRHAPEAKFPAQHDDAAAAYAWVLGNAAKWGGDTRRVALAGESAGGNLAVATAIFARDHHLTMPRAVLAVYPIADARRDLPSKLAEANAAPLNTAMLGWFTYYTVAKAADVDDARINLVGANLRGLPPVTIVNAEIDPLRSDGEALDKALRAAGNRVERRVYPGVTHEFFGMGQVVAGALAAETFAAGRLRAALAD